MIFSKKYFSIITIFSLFLFSNHLISQKDKKTNTVKILKPIMSFPSESDKVLLIFPTEMQMDEENNIYIIDQNLNAIVKYNSDGKFIKMIGRQGEGPSEFERPHEFFYDQKKLYIVDQGNRRVQILGSEGQYISSFKLFRLITNIAHFNNTIIGQQQYRSYEIKNFSLLTKYSYDGKILDSFGDPINETIEIAKLPPDASSVMLHVYNEFIYVLYCYYPVLQVYSIDGELINIYKFKNNMYRDLIKDNYNIQKIMAQRNYINLKFLFLAFDVNDNGIFLCLYKEDIEIHHYNFEGNMQSIYSFKHKEDDDYYVTDLRVMNYGEDYKFYILTYLPWPRVRVFTSN
jgi:hypothetical protein